MTETAWTPIDSAPKDGGWLIGLVGGKACPICWEADEDDDEHVGWCVATSSYGGVLYSLHCVPDAPPTHWVPLPPPPAS